MKTFIIKLLVFILLNAQSLMAVDQIQIRLNFPESGRAKYIEINKSASFEELKQKILNICENYEEFMCISGSKPIDWTRTDSAVNQAMMQHILQIKQLTLIVRLKGGAGIIDKMCETVKNDSFGEIFSHEGECGICSEDKNKIANFSCGCSYCKGCFDDFFNIFSMEGVNKNCPIHKNHNLIDESVVLLITHCKREDIIDCYSRLVEYIMLIRCMDFKFCKCDTLHQNTTGYPKQFCPQCKENVCFYCQESWNESKQNTVGYCGDKCFYYDLVNPSLEAWEWGGTEIPSIRACPECSYRGGFDKRCKYHTCKCGITYCFFCLNKQADCSKKYSKSYKEKCVEPVKQNFKDIFEKKKLKEF